MKKLILLLPILLTNCNRKDPGNNEFVVTSIGTFYNYTDRNKYHVHSIKPVCNFYFIDSIGKFKVFDTLILVKK